MTEPSQAEGTAAGTAPLTETSPQPPRAAQLAANRWPGQTVFDLAGRTTPGSSRATESAPTSSILAPLAPIFSIALPPALSASAPGPSDADPSATLSADHTPVPKASLMDPTTTQTHLNKVCSFPGNSGPSPTPCADHDTSLQEALPDSTTATQSHLRDTHSSAFYGECFCLYQQLKISPFIQGDAAKRKEALRTGRLPYFALTFCPASCFVIADLYDQPDLSDAQVLHILCCRLTGTPHDSLVKACSDFHAHQPEAHSLANFPLPILIHDRVNPTHVTPSRVTPYQAITFYPVNANVRVGTKAGAPAVSPATLLDTSAETLGASRAAKRPAAPLWVLPAKRPRNSETPNSRCAAPQLSPLQQAAQQSPGPHLGMLQYHSVRLLLHHDPAVAITPDFDCTYSSQGAWVDDDYNNDNRFKFPHCSAASPVVLLDGRRPIVWRHGLPGYYGVSADLMLIMQWHSRCHFCFSRQHATRHCGNYQDFYCSGAKPVSWAPPQRNGPDFQQPLPQLPAPQQHAAPRQYSQPGPIRPAWGQAPGQCPQGGPPAGPQARGWGRGRPPHPPSYQGY